MVKILNGEIVADDDPRLQQRHSPPKGPASGPVPSGPAAPAAGAGGGGGGGTGFNANAPPFRFVDPAPGTEALFGLPDMEIFGVRITPYAVLAAVGLGMFMGWRGVAIALVLYYVYLANQGTRPGAPAQGQGHGQARGPQQAGSQTGPGQQQQPQQQQQQFGGAAADFLTRYLNGPQPPSRARAAGRQGDSGPSGHGGPAPAAGQRAAGGGTDEGPAEGAAGGTNWAAFQGKGHKLGK